MSSLKWDSYFWYFDKPMVQSFTVIRMLSSSRCVLSEFADVCQLILNIANIKYVIIKQCNYVSKLKGYCDECKKII